jgi:hypothetical protein
MTIEVSMVGRPEIFGIFFSGESTVALDHRGLYGRATGNFFFSYIAFRIPTENAKLTKKTDLKPGKTQKQRSRKTLRWWEPKGLNKELMEDVAEVYGGGDMARTASGDGAAATRLLWSELETLTTLDANTSTRHNDCRQRLKKQKLKRSCNGLAGAMGRMI